MDLLKKEITPILHVNCDIYGFTFCTKQYLWRHLGKLMNSKIKKRIRNHFSMLIVLFVVSHFIQNNVWRISWLICMNYDLKIRFSVPIPSFTHLKCNIIFQQAGAELSHTWDLSCQFCWDHLSFWAKANNLFI